MDTISSIASSANQLPTIQTRGRGRGARRGSGRPQKYQSEQERLESHRIRQAAYRKRKQQERQVCEYFFLIVDTPQRFILLFNKYLMIMSFRPLWRPKEFLLKRTSKVYQKRRIIMIYK